MPEEVNGRTHRYYAEATVLSGHLQLPLRQEIRPQAHKTLPDDGGYIYERTEDYRLEGVISISSAYTQVAGNLSTKPGQGWTTLTTTVLEGLNVLDVLTADRVVGQTITEHPLEGYVPSVSFLGTRFENLRVAGHPVALDLDLDILGPKPANDASYTQAPGVIERVAGQYKRILENDRLPAALREYYDRLLSDLAKQNPLECSLVNRATGAHPGHTYGHIIDIPDFGKIALAKLTVTPEDFHPETGAPRKTTLALTMVDLQLGCVTAGSISAGLGVTNGQSNP